MFIQFMFKEMYYRAISWVKCATVHKKVIFEPSIMHMSIHPSIHTAHMYAFPQVTSFSNVHRPGNKARSVSLDVPLSAAYSAHTRWLAGNEL